MSSRFEIAALFTKLVFWTLMNLDDFHMYKMWRTAFNRSDFNQISFIFCTILTDVVWKRPEPERTLLPTHVLLEILSNPLMWIERTIEKSLFTAGCTKEPALLVLHTRPCLRRLWSTLSFLHSCSLVNCMIVSLQCWCRLTFHLCPVRALLR